MRERATTYYGDGEHTIYADHDFYNHWIRLAGHGGDVLSTQVPNDPQECGAVSATWLSDWDPSGASFSAPRRCGGAQTDVTCALVPSDFGTPPTDYAVPATLPSPEDGI